MKLLVTDVLALATSEKQFGTSECARLAVSKPSKSRETYGHKHLSKEAV